MRFYLEWRKISGSWVLIPRHPKGILHFLGGAFVATAPELTYRWLLEQLAAEGYAIVTTPFVNTLDHAAIAQSVSLSFERTLEQLHAKSILSGYLPIYGIGHSMGCKLHLLSGSLFSVERAGNILISFNNYAARDAIPLVQEVKPAFDVEFTPSPQETNRLIQQQYNVRRNLLVKFTNDTIDQSLELSQLLQQRFPDMVTLQILKGSHTTPLGQDLRWQAGKDFTLVDALVQRFKQEVYRDLQQLKQAIALWLNPVSIR